LGNAYYFPRRISTAIDFHQQSLIKREIGDRQGEANSLGNLGNAYFSLGDYQRAIDFHQRSGEISDRHGEALGNLGTAHSVSWESIARAIDFYQQSISDTAGNC
jgi:tetratricopeptide (TPR) repeat protein